MDLSHATSPARLPRLLIAQKNFSTIEPLIRTCGDRRLDVDFDVCASPSSARGMLLANSYQLVISGALLAEMDDFLLLKQTEALNTFVPFVVTASTPEKESARRVLGRGALDLITYPVNHEDTVGTILRALWHGKFRDLIARKDKALEQYRQHMADYPDDKRWEESYKRALAAVEKTISSVERSIERVEESMVCFSDFATKAEHYARKRALERLDSLRT